MPGIRVAILSESQEWSVFWEDILYEQDWRDDFHLSRKDFLKYSLSTGVVMWAGTQVPGGLGISEAQAADLFEVSRINPRRYPQSVASGDPQPNGIVLWT